jgi:hypothetical protein
LKRLGQVLRGRFSGWNEANIAALRSARHLLTEDARQLVDTFETMRKGSFAARLAAFAGSPLRRQTSIGNVALLVAVAMKKL